jgi:hypothetical protein
MGVYPLSVVLAVIAIPDVGCVKKFQLQKQKNKTG